jgi:hypothetical protein
MTKMAVNQMVTSECESLKLPIAAQLAPAPELRRKLRDWHRECERVDAQRRSLATNEEIAERRGMLFIDTGCIVPIPLPKYPPFPPECEGMACGAKAKSTGAPCKSTQIFRNGRCRHHGGLSTGPKSTAGKLAALGNLKQFTEPQGLPDKS